MFQLEHLLMQCLQSPIDSGVVKRAIFFSAKLYTPMYLGTDLVLPGNSDS